jgi:hypothetical protein
MARWQLSGLVVSAALAGGVGPASRPPASGATVDAATHSAILHFGGGRQVLSFRMHEPGGAIRVYRISVPAGARVRASAQLPRITVPLRIATMPVGPSSACTALGGRVTCAVGEEGCPMPEGTWSFRVEKLAGPAGDVTLRFGVGDPGGGL